MEKKLSKKIIKKIHHTMLSEVPVTKFYFSKTSALQKMIKSVHNNIQFPIINQGAVSIYR